MYVLVTTALRTLHQAPPPQTHTRTHAHFTHAHTHAHAHKCSASLLSPLLPASFCGGQVTVAGCTTGCQRLGAAPGVLWRCVSKDTPFPVYSATFNDPSCGSAGPNAGLALQFVPDAQLGFALSTVQAM